MHPFRSPPIPLASDDDSKHVGHCIYAAGSVHCIRDLSRLHITTNNGDLCDRPAQLAAHIGILGGILACDHTYTANTEGRTLLYPEAPPPSGVRAPCPSITSPAPVSLCTRHTLPTSCSVLTHSHDLDPSAVSFKTFVPPERAQLCCFFDLCLACTGCRGMTTQTLFRLS